MKFERSHLMFGLMCLIWGATWIAVKAGVSVVPPIFFAGTRFVAAGALMLLFLWVRGSQLLISRADLPRLSLVTVLMVASTYALLFWGAQFVSSGIAAILDLAFMPVALLSIGVLFGEDRFTYTRGIGVTIGIGGLLILFGPKAFGGAAASSTAELLGGTAIVVSALTYSFGSVLARPLLRTYPAFLLSGFMLLGGGLLLLFGSIGFEPGAAVAMSGRWGAAAWASWLFLVLFGSLIAFTIFLQLVEEWGASRAGAYAFVSPAIAVLLGIWVFGEVLTAVDALGMATMLAGAWLTLRPAPVAKTTL